MLLPISDKMPVQVLINRSCPILPYLQPPSDEKGYFDLPEASTAPIVPPTTMRKIDNPQLYPDASKRRAVPPRKPGLR